MLPLSTLRFSHSNSSNTVVKCSLKHMTRNNEFHPVGQYFNDFFPASCIRRSVALHDLFTLFTIANTLFILLYMLVQF